MIGDKNSRGSAAYIAYAVAWISTAVAITYGIHITGRPMLCLWALIFPAGIRIGRKEDEKDHDKQSNREADKGNDEAE